MAHRIPSFSTVPAWHGIADPRIESLGSITGGVVTFDYVRLAAMQADERETEIDSDLAAEVAFTNDSYERRFGGLR